MNEVSVDKLADKESLTTTVLTSEMSRTRNYAATHDQHICDETTAFHNDL